MDDKRKPSEIIQEFMDLLDFASEEYRKADEQINKYNKRTYDWTHKLESCVNKQDRNKLAYAWQCELKQRRAEKDRMSMYKEISKLNADPATKTFLRKLVHTLQQQKGQEEYVATPYGEREYKKGGDNIDDS